MRKKSIKVSVGHTGFHFFQIHFGSTPKPSIRVMNFDMRPNSGKLPFEVGMLDVSAIDDALRNQTIAFGSRPERLPVSK